MKTKYVIYQVSGIVGVEGNGQVLYPVVNGVSETKEKALSKLEELLEDRVRYTILEIYEK